MLWDVHLPPKRHELSFPLLPPLLELLLGVLHLLHQLHLQGGTHSGGHSLQTSEHRQPQGWRSHFIELEGALQYVQVSHDPWGTHSASRQAEAGIERLCRAAGAAPSAV